MDLSGIIFAGLAVAWAVYLIPKALRHHDEMARSRSVDRFSHTMRVLGRKGTEPAAAPAPAPAAAPAVEVPARPERAKPAKAPTRHTVTRESARRAAARRRRVLGLLLLATAVVAGLAWRAIVPWWSLAIPGGLVLVFLVIARITVRRERARVADRSEPTPEAETEDTVGLSRDELAAAVSAPVDPSVSPEVLADEGSLWDPLPMTLPTYVHKARARRTVRTIELTQTAGVTSSGHDDADSALVAAAESAPAEQPAEERKVAGA
ncbi:MAG TPA: hypothetical protein VFR99_01355 [Marmoricola sp.]|nr:hypothetical protein [Marmoricola sp.]